MEWVDPVYCSGHWVPEMVELAGGIDLLSHKGAELNLTESEDIWLATQNAHAKLEPGGDIDIANDKAQVVLKADGKVLVAAAAGADVTLQRGDTQIVVRDHQIHITSTCGVHVEGKEAVTVSVGRSKINLTESEAAVTVGSSKFELTSEGAKVTAAVVKLNS